MAHTSMGFWGAADEGEKKLKHLFPDLRTPGQKGYRKFEVHTDCTEDGNGDERLIRCTLYLVDYDKDAVASFLPVVVKDETPEEFPSENLIAQCALFLG